MNILVTGLCLSRNLGGPAIGLTLINEIKKRFAEAKFIFAIPARHYRQEKKWGAKYGIEIVRSDTLIEYLGTKYKVHQLYRKLKYRKHQSRPRVGGNILWQEVHQEFMQAYKNSDCVIDMSGIAYVSWANVPLCGLRYYSVFYYAKKNKKPFIRFIQSFGPFDKFDIRFFAKRELRQLPFVLARGKKAASFCRELVSDKGKVFDSPDIAILLPLAKQDWFDAYAQKLKIKTKEYVVLSPSAVIYSMLQKDGNGLGEGHLESFYLIARKLISQNEKVVFLPHMYSDLAKESDRQVCYKVLAKLEHAGVALDNVKIIEEDIDPMQAKSIIANSKLAIVSRYHALVAAASTATAAIALAWNVKYADLLAYYDLRKMAINSHIYSPQEILCNVFEKMRFYEDANVRETMINFQHVNVAKVEKAFSMLFKWMEE